jgi:hypothetical protein
MHKTFPQLRFFTGLHLIFALVFMLVGGVVPNTAYADALTDKSDILSSLKASTVSNHTVLFTTPTGVAAGETITLTLTSFSATSTLDFEDLDLSFEASGGDGVCDTGDTEITLAGTKSGATWSAVRTSATVITFESDTGTIAAGAEVCVEVGTGAEEGTAGVEQITNPATGSYTLAIGGTMADSGSVAIEIIDDDQVSVSATVDESLTFTISDNSIGFGTLSASDDFFATGDTNGSATEVEAHTLVVGTNATNGYTMTLNGATLTSGSDTIDAIGDTNTASATSTEQFGLRIDESGGSGVVSAPYAAAGFAFDTAAFPDQVASAAGASANTTYSVRYLANITSSTEAGAYTATLTYVATANF